jgi:C4-dicarboxylate-specific signal transduction histidine kinase
VIEVSDNGPGIAEADRAALFQPFQTGKPTGLGLGLVISRDLERDLGGDLVCLESDAGARFRLTLPIATSRPAA